MNGAYPYHLHLVQLLLAVNCAPITTRNTSRVEGSNTFLKSRTPCLVKSEIKPVKSVFACKLKRFSRKLKATYAEIS